LSTPRLGGNGAIVVRTSGIAAELVVFAHLTIAAAQKGIVKLAALAMLPAQMMPENQPRFGIDFRKLLTDRHGTK
jgi:hypothetical protein